MPLHNTGHSPTNATNAEQNIFIAEFLEMIISSPFYANLDFYNVLDWQPSKINLNL